MKYYGQDQANRFMSMWGQR